MTNIALIGDYSSSAPAHQAIPVALKRVAQELPLDLTWRWIATRELSNPAVDLLAFAAIWVVPASPYENPTGVFDAIRWVRENRRPFLGTCGGFQHALIEFARNVLGVSEADHAETNPGGSRLVVSPLQCSLVEQSGPLRLAPDTKIRSAYGRDSANEGYRCNYGPNVAFRAAFETAGLHFTAFDEAGEPRAAELVAALHPFFVGTLFQPERAALRGETPPLVRAFVQAAAAFRL